jgi:AAA+ ATPase superfamily predicted ATPase
MEFVDRTCEMKILSDLRNRLEPQFVVYGRRRIGKIALITHYLWNRSRNSGKNLSSMLD